MRPAWWAWVLSLALVFALQIGTMLQTGEASMSRFLIAAVALALLALFFLPLFRGGSKADTSRDGEVPFIQLPDDDLIMAQAKIEARANLGRFLKELRANEPGDYFVKIALPNSKGTTEHIWVRVKEAPEGDWKGTLDNKPVDLPGLQQGSVVTFQEEDIEDWIIGRDGKMVGGYSVEALRSRKDQQEKK